MNDHTTALVPLETWAYQSPDVRSAGYWIDIGLLAESLIYYDRVLVAPASNATYGFILNEPPPDRVDVSASERPLFVPFVEWFSDRGALDDLFALLREGSLQIYHYAFETLPMFKGGVYSIWNMQDEEQAAGRTFERRILQHPSLNQAITKGRTREKLYRAVRDRVIEAHSSDFERAIENAREDLVSGVYAESAVQAIVDDTFRRMGLAEPPEIKVTTERTAEKTHLTWNCDFNDIARALGPSVPFGNPIVLAGLAHSNRLIWSAALQSSDLFLPSPISRLVSLKMREANQRRTNIVDTLDELKIEVEFPDVRTLVNRGELPFSDVLILRKKAQRFRNWLQTQAERDRNAIIAYHNEVAKESGLVSATRKGIKVLGVGGGAVVGATVGAQIGPEATATAAAVGALAGQGIEYVFDVAAKLNADWKPVMFGNWARDFTERKTKAG